MRMVRPVDCETAATPCLLLPSGVLHSDLIGPTPRLELGVKHSPRIWVKRTKSSGFGSLLRFPGGLFALRSGASPSTRAQEVLVAHGAGISLAT